jgi:hypothetical protein
MLAPSLKLEEIRDIFRVTNRDDIVACAAAGRVVDGAVDELLKELEVTLYSRFSPHRYERRNTQHPPRSFFRGEDLLYQNF